jgi:aminopeptidase N
MNNVDVSVGESSSSSRLPITIFPNHYEIIYNRIDLDSSYMFEGSVLLTGTSISDDVLSKIVVHAKEIQITHATFSLHNNNNVDPTTPVVSIDAEEFHYSMKNETCELRFPKSKKYSLSKDTMYVLAMNFVGILNNQMRGFYRSTYIGLDLQTKIMATTQFEPTDARRAFPCIDEPAAKATFQLTVTIPNNLQSISNTPIASIHSKIVSSSSNNTNSNNKSIMKTITFQTTPKMSTYLVALIVGEFDGISQTSNNIVSTVYTVPGKALLGQFCLETAVRCLDLYQELYGIAYPLTKSDLIAIPDFAAGAMENWYV